MMKKVLAMFIAVVLSFSFSTQIQANENQKIKWIKQSEEIYSAYGFNSITRGNGVYVAVGYDGLTAVSKDGETWEWSDSGTGYDLNQVIWNGRIFVAVGENGTILTSTDGRKWIRREPPVFSNFVNIAWNGKFFIAFAWFPYKSTDGINWTSCNIDLKSFNILPDYPGSLYWDGQQFILLSQNGIFSSKDGDHWAEKSNLYGSDSLAYNGKNYVIVGKYSDLLYSSDAVHWTKTNSEGTYGMEHVIWTGSRFIAVGEEDAMTSVDGITWEDLPISEKRMISNVYGDNDGIILSGSHSYFMKYSPDSIWKSSSSDFSRGIKSIAFDGVKYRAVGVFKGVLNSDNGVEWEKPKEGTMNSESDYDTYYNSIIWNGKCFLAVGDNKSMISFDGDHWETHTITYVNWASDNPNKTELESVIWDGTRFIAVSGYKYDDKSDCGKIFTSLDGISWKESSVRSDKSILSIAASPTIRVAVGLGGTIYTSTDGVEWIKRQAPTSSDLLSVEYDGKSFIAVGPDTIIYSTDGIYWQEKAGNPSEELYYKTWDGKRYAALGFDSKDGSASINFSKDKVSWESHKLPSFIKGVREFLWNGKNYVLLYDDGSDMYFASSSNGLKWDVRKKVKYTNSVATVKWTGKMFIAVGYDGLILTSPDGISWSQSKSGTSKDLFDVVWNGSKFIAVGRKYGSQVVLTSKDGKAWSQVKVDLNRMGDVQCVIWNGKQFLICMRGAVAASKDGIKWTIKEVGNISFRDIIWNGSFYIAASGWPGAEPGRVVTSPDGLNWTTRVQLDGDSELDGSIYNTDWDGKEYTAESASMTFTSKNGLEWNSVLDKECLKFTCIASNGNSYVAGGQKGLLSFSVDGVHWSYIDTNTDSDFYSVTWDGRKYIACGYNGVIFTGEF